MGIIGGTCFATDIIAFEFCRGPGPGSIGGNPTQQIVHDIGRAGVYGARPGVSGNCRLGPHDYLATAVGDIIDQERVNTVTAIGTYAKAGSQDRKSVV